jgi:hypothetical protein
VEEARRDGMLDFRETRITAQAACSLPGFLYSWYRPDGRLGAEEVVQELTVLVARLLGLQDQRGLPSATLVAGAGSGAAREEASSRLSARSENTR